MMSISATTLFNSFGMAAGWAITLSMSFFDDSTLTQRISPGFVFGFSVDSS